MDEGDILSALQKGVTAAVAASSTPALPISYVGLVFATPSDGQYLEIIWISNNREGDFWGEEKNYQGIMRLVLHRTNDGQQPYTALALLKSICEYFSKGRVLSGVQIYEKPNLSGSPIVDGSEILWPVSIRYQSFRS